MFMISIEPFPNFQITFISIHGNADKGAVSEVASVTAGSQYSRTPRGLYIQPFPSFMTRGNGQTFSFYTKSNDLYSCTPGYTVSSYSPFTGRLEYQAVPGRVGDRVKFDQ